MLTRVLLGLIAGLLAFPASAENRPGDFDFYVLALSWSPSYCAAEGRSANPAQCGSGGPAGFTVHGLWPQYEKGYPESCPTEEPLRVPSSLAAALADIMPSVGFVGYQWRKHGACSGLSQEEYFALLRDAWERIDIPEDFEDPARDSFVSAAAVEEAFAAGNPGLSPRGIAVSCKSDRLAEICICLTPGLEFRRCAEVDDRGCRDRRLLLPAGG